MKTIRGQVFTPDGQFEYGEIVIDKRTICAVNYLSEADLLPEQKGILLIPGLVDIHMHGCVGHDHCDANYESEKAIAEYEAEHGITSFLATTMTFDEQRLTRICRSLSNASKDIAGLKGIYLEGPFLSEAKCGAQDPSYISKPDVKLLQRLDVASEKLIKIVAIAPESEGAVELIENGCNNYNFSIAHTNADEKTTKTAIDAGAKHVTHLYNAMSSFGHRNPGVVGAVMDSDDTVVELICDGVHVHPMTIRNTFKIFGRDRIVFISDSMEATGMADGEYSLGGQTVYKNGNIATLADGTIAGSVSNLWDCMKYAISIGIDACDAIICAAKNPAIEGGIYSEVGSLEAGKAADILVLNTDLELMTVIQGEDTF